jgi:hypothetical protein
MSNIEFEGDVNQGTQFAPGANPYVQNTSGGMAAWLVKRGIISDESQAKGILLGLVVVNLVVTAVVIYYFI